MSVARHRVRRRGQSGMVGRATGRRPASVPCLRGAQHVYRRGLPQEGEPSGRGALMATLAEPVGPGAPRPNVASANIQLPAVESYEQVDRDIAGTLVATK